MYHNADFEKLCRENLHYMRKNELLELVRFGENPNIVFQPDTIASHAFAKELVALLNLRGDRVILGVGDGSVIGITRDRLEEWVMTACKEISATWVTELTIWPSISGGLEMYQ